MSTPANAANNPLDARLAAWLVRPLAGTPVTPNHLTALGLVCGLAAGVLYALGDPWLADLAAVLFMVSALIDHADGELARRTGKFTRFGYYFDHATGAVNYVALFLGIGIGLRSGDLGAWAVPMGAAAGVAVAAIFTLRFAIEGRQGTDSFQQPAAGGFEIEDIMYLIGPVTWLGGLHPFLILSAVGAPVFALWLAWQFRRLPAPAPDEERP